MRTEEIEAGKKYRGKNTRQRHVVYCEYGLVEYRTSNSSHIWMMTLENFANWAVEEVK